MTRPHRSEGAYVAMNKQQKEAFRRWCRREKVSGSELLSRKLGRKFWADLDREVLRGRTEPASRSESGNGT